MAVEPVQEPNGTANALGEVIATAAVTAALVPFVQAVAKKAGEDSYDAVRGWLRGLFHKAKDKRTPPGENPRELLVVSDLDPSVKLFVPTDASDQAIDALTHLDLSNELERRKRGEVAKIRIYFDKRTGTWRTDG
ncbi:hypothetical protein [Kibdelosporangium aridum]|uniref:hypothetical protein n=1 Tax=Kibdelosporangium aridum TaxID=2030 RepID=UPI000B3043E9|nr:hypothetical protein [Kibdelosporangium aridum]